MSEKGSMKKENIDKIVKYIRDHIEKEITLDDISNHLNYSKYYLSRTFKKQTGASIKEYIEAIKIEKSIEKIMNNEDSVTDIAYDVKHKSIGTFSNTFKHHTKISPKNYKKESNCAYDFIRNLLKKRISMIHYESFTETNNSISIKVKYPEDYQNKITCVGLFKTAIPKDEPIIGVVTVDNLEFTIKNIPNGNYYLFACELLEDLTIRKNYVLVDNYRALNFNGYQFLGSSNYTCELEMRRPADSDPPITMNIPAFIMHIVRKNRNL